MTSSITTHHNRPSVSELSAALDEYRRKAEQAGIRPGDPLHAWVEATDRLFEGMAARLDENETRQDDSLQKLHEAVYKITQISLLLTKPSPPSPIPIPAETLEGHVVKDGNGMLAVCLEVVADMLPFLRRPECLLLLLLGGICSSFFVGIMTERNDMNEHMAQTISAAKDQADRERKEAQNKIAQAEKQVAEVVTAAHEHDAAVAEFQNAMRQAPPSILAWAAVVKSNPFTESMRNQCRNTIQMSQRPPYWRSCSIEIWLESQDVVNAIIGN